jgi:predicted HD phosphohydrolase
LEDHKVNRRRLIELGAGGCAAGLVGLAAGYKVHDRIRAATSSARETTVPANSPRQRFKAKSSEIVERHRQQTNEDVQALKAKYESPILGKFRVWDLIEQLSLCIDPSDNRLGVASQYVHVCQILQVMERDDVLDETMLLTALLHDLGKLALLAGEAPENVVCFTEPVEEREAEAGLDNVLFQFGHDEIAYSRIKDHVPPHVAWLVRYHSMYVGKAEKYMSPQDREYAQQYLAKFSRYDHGTKSTAFRPTEMTLERHRDFVESRFPNPILF